MQVFRLCRKKYGLTLYGKGAALKGARWNSPGTEIIYTAANRSLAMAEVAVHFTIATLPADYYMLTIDVPSDIIPEKLNTHELPNGWNAFPPSRKTQQYGDDFIRGKKGVILRVPSVVTAGDYNYLINPYHPDFERVEIMKADPFPFDQRLFE